MRYLEFDQNAIEDLIWWSKNNNKIVPKILKLSLEICKTPFEGTGKPEPLKDNLQGLWSRHINIEHRIIYEVFDNKIRIIACRFHYDRK